MWTRTRGFISRMNMEINQVIHGDCLEVMTDIPDNSIDMVVCDLPYGISRDSGFKHNSPDKKDYIKKYGKHVIDFGDWDTKELDLDILASEYYRLLKDGGVCVIFYDIWGATNVKTSFSKFKQHRVLQWIKNNPVPINSKINILSNSVEYMFSFVKKGNPTFNGEYHMGVFKYPLCHGKERTEHPTQKPVALLSEIIQLYTNENDLILDNCAGSSSTAIACINTNRNYIMIEKEQKYIDVSNERIKNHSIKKVTVNSRFF